MNPGIPTQLPFGRPATGYLEINSVPLADDTVTIGVVTYTYGTDFSGNSPLDVAKSLTNAINANHLATSPVMRGDVIDDPIKEVFAYFVGTRVWLINRTPGSAGNALSIESDNEAAMEPSGETMSGGTDGPGTTESSVSATVGPATGLKTTDDTGLIDNPDRLWWMVINCNTAPLKGRMAAGAAADNFDFPMQASAAEDDGTGGYFSDSTHKGVVTVFSESTYRYNVIEMLKA